LVQFGFYFNWKKNFRVDVLQEAKDFVSRVQTQTGNWPGLYGGLYWRLLLRNTGEAAGQVDGGQSVVGSWCRGPQKRSAGQQA